MIVLVSDLHLQDSITPATTIDVRRLLSRLNYVVRDAHDKGVQDLRLVLLGDIFEFLKSEHWLRRTIRPWQSTTQHHVETVTAIMEGIVSTNEIFFEGLALLVKNYDFVRLHYIPGNHDRPINTEMGGPARALLLDILPLATEGDRFPVNLRDQKHRLFAQHGHEWDLNNRYANGSVAYGDALVIEFILAIPWLVAKNQGISPDRLPSFLYEIDNVRPSGLKTIVQWIKSNLPAVKNSNPSLALSVEEAMNESLERLRSLKREFKFETVAKSSWRFDLIAMVLGKLGKRYGYLQAGQFLPLGEEESAAYGEFALGEFQTMLELDEDYDYLVCGHTHTPAVIPLFTSDGAGRQLVRLYLNTGTWRRVQRLVYDEPAKGKRAVTFTCQNEECVVTICSAEDQKLGYAGYEFYRLTSGTD